MLKAVSSPNHQGEPWQPPLHHLLYQIGHRWGNPRGRKCHSLAASICCFAYRFRQRPNGSGHEGVVSVNSRSTMSSIKRSCPFFHEGSKFVASECLHLLRIFHGRRLPTLRSPRPPCMHPIAGTLPTLEQIEIETIHMRKVCQLSSVGQAATG